MSDRSEPRSIEAAIDGLTFLADRTPTTTDAEAFARLAPYRDGAVFVGHWAGTSEWERHPVGDEIVLVVDGGTTIVLLEDGTEQAHRMGPGELIVVPQGTWHRFETPDAVKVLSVTPQPTEHRTEVGEPPPD